MKIIIEVNGGSVTSVYTDADQFIDVEVLDYDNYYDPDRGEEATGSFSELEEEIKSMHTIW